MPRSLWLRYAWSVLLPLLIPVLCIDHIYLKEDHISFLVISPYPTFHFERLVDSQELKWTVVLIETT